MYACVTLSGLPGQIARPTEKGAPYGADRFIPDVRCVCVHVCVHVYVCVCLCVLCVSSWLTRCLLACKQLWPLINQDQGILKWPDCTRANMPNCALPGRELIWAHKLCGIGRRILSRNERRLLKKREQATVTSLHITTNGQLINLRSLQKADLGAVPKRTTLRSCVMTLR